MRIDYGHGVKADLTKDGVVVHITCSALALIAILEHTHGRLLSVTPSFMYTDVMPGLVLPSFIDPEIADSITQGFGDMAVYYHHLTGDRRYMWPMASVYEASILLDSPEVTDRLRKAVSAAHGMIRTELETVLNLVESVKGGTVK